MVVLAGIGDTETQRDAIKEAWLSAGNALACQILTGVEQ